MKFVSFFRPHRRLADAEARIARLEREVAGRDELIDELECGMEAYADIVGMAVDEGKLNLLHGAVFGICEAGHAESLSDALLLSLANSFELPLEEAWRLSDEIKAAAV